jgi:hypothetical protein
MTAELANCSNRIGPRSRYPALHKIAVGGQSRPRADAESESVCDQLSITARSRRLEEAIAYLQGLPEEDIDEDLP